jgi:hypothetical protein
MRYLLMIFSEETPPDQVSPEEWGQVMEEYNEFGRRLRERGAMLGGEALQDSGTATTIRVRDGQTLTTDGPFIESKEQFGGYYLFEAKDLDEAIELASWCPGAKYGTIEIRPVMEFPDAASAAAEQGQPTSAATA